jgi:hypothetical protein
MATDPHSASDDRLIAATIERIATSIGRTHDQRIDRRPTSEMTPPSTPVR